MFPELFSLSFFSLRGRPKETSKKKASNPFTDANKAKSKVKVCFGFKEGEKKTYEKVSLALVIIDSQTIFNKLNLMRAQLKIQRLKIHD